MDRLSEFTYYRSYARWNDDFGRRETWHETAQRYIQFMREILGNALSQDEYREVLENINALRVLPSMRLLWSAGSAARATHVSAYSCSYIAPSHPTDVSQILYLLMCGTGVGFSVESGIIQGWPTIRPQQHTQRSVHTIDDSRKGWADALSLGIDRWFNGDDIDFDYSKIRPPGARIHTLGGRSAGSAPLSGLLKYVRAVILNNQGKRLGPINAHDIICKLAEAVSMGGVRRSALISLSDLNDFQMRHAKSGPFFKTHPHRMMANNAAVYTQRPDATEFLEEWLALTQAGTGERGIFNRGSIATQIPRRRRQAIDDALSTCGTNPCGEVILQSQEFCNLTEVIARPHDTERSLGHKIRLATILGTFQSTLTDFPDLPKAWRFHCEQERLLGVSISGIWDCAAARKPEVLKKLRALAVTTNRQYAKRFGIKPSLAVTCIKPSGTASLLVNCAPGMHPRHAPYYIRRVRIAACDPLFALLREQGIPHLPEIGQSFDSATTFVIEFPVKSPKGSVTSSSLSAMDQLEHWKRFKTHFTEHNPSMTILVKPDEWISTAHWVYSHWDVIGGLSFYPRQVTPYPLPPYEAITATEYARREHDFPEIDYSRLSLFEKEDTTNPFQPMECMSDGSLFSLPRKEPC